MKTFKKYLIHYTHTFSRWSIRVIRFSWYFDNLDGIEQHVKIESKFSSSSICRRPNFFKLLFNFSLNRAYLTVVSVLNVLFERSQCHSNCRHFFDCLENVRTSKALVFELSAGSFICIFESIAFEKFGERESRSFSCKLDLILPPSVLPGVQSLPFLLMYGSKALQ